MEIIGECLGTNETYNSVFCKYSSIKSSNLTFSLYLFALVLPRGMPSGQTKAKIRLGLLFKVVTITKSTDMILESNVVYFRSCSLVIDLIFSRWLKNVLGVNLQTASIVILTTDWKRCISPTEGCFSSYLYNLLGDVHCWPSRCAYITYGVVFWPILMWEPKFRFPETPNNSL